MLEMAAAKPGERALDVATGTGLVLFPLAKAVGPRGVAVGADFTPAMLAQAQRHRTEQMGEEHVTLLAADATALPLQANSLDVVTCRFAVHHFSDPAAALAAMAAALRSGGRLIVADFVRPSDPAQATDYDTLERLRGHEYVRIYEQERLLALLEGCGCPAAEVRYVEREQTMEQWLTGPNVAAENREPLRRLLESLQERGGGGLIPRRVDGETRLVRADLVLRGLKK